MASGTRCRISSRCERSTATVDGSTAACVRVQGPDRAGRTAVRGKELVELGHRQVRNVSARDDAERPLRRGIGLTGHELYAGQPQFQRRPGLWLLAADAFVPGDRAIVLPGLGFQVGRLQHQNAGPRDNFRQFGMAAQVERIFVKNRKYAFETLNRRCAVPRRRE